ncbi:methyltransferase domain-containing protein [Desulfonatronospira sp.]|uniref:methyltransferase domain-containing protein n=1 Tax=Desulfonatronospira sp. TaxID=1962951 RepID=UPI0025C2501E|nr:methyltransferase domain-containing protein [Desulfonatronospira sp.]
MSRQVQKYFDRAAGTYLEEAVIQEEAARRCAGNIPRGYYPRVLEIGAGGGLLTRHCLERIRAGIYLAMDVSSPMLRLLPLDRVVPVQADGEVLPLREQSLDLLTSSSVMQWYASGAQGIARSLSFLSPGGFFSLSLFVAGTFRQMKHISSMSGFGSVYPLPRVRECMAAISRSGTEYKSRVESYTVYYDSVQGFLKSHKGTGAGYTGRKPVFGRQSYGNFCRMYLETYGEGGRIPVDYRVLYIRGQKK